MNLSIRKKWVAALRSGKYNQGQSQLRRTSPLSDRPQFCCLGVLCESMGVGYKGSSCYPSAKTLKAAGLDRKQAIQLAMMNDRDNMPFTTIAHHIERNL